MDNKLNTTVKSGNCQAATGLYIQAGNAAAATVRRTAGRFEITSLAEAAANEDCAQIARQLDLPGPEQRDQSPVVAGFDTLNVVFDCLAVPDVPADQMASVVSYQAETLLPLASEDIRTAYNSYSEADGSRKATLAAARKSTLNRFTQRLGAIKPDRIYLDSQAIVTLWQCAFTRGRRDGLLIDIRGDKTVLCLVSDNVMVNSMTLESGSDQLSAVDNISMERFVQDIRSAIMSFGLDNASGLELFVISDGSEHRRLLDWFGQNGLKAELSVPEPQALSGAQAGDIYHYRTAIGLALMRLGCGDVPLDLFAYLRQEQQPRRGIAARGIKAAAVAAALMIVLLLAGFYYADLARLNAAEAELAQAKASLQDSQQEIPESIAQYRINPLELIQSIQDSHVRGVAVQSLEFIRGRTTRLTGTAGRTEQLYEFQNNLLRHEDISQVQIDNATEQNRTVNFTISFNYKNFGR